MVSLPTFSRRPSWLKPNKVDQDLPSAKPNLEGNRALGIYRSLFPGHFPGDDNLFPGTSIRTCPYEVHIFGHLPAAKTTKNRKKNCLWAYALMTCNELWLVSSPYDRQSLDYFHLYWWVYFYLLFFLLAVKIGTLLSIWFDRFWEEDKRKRFKKGKKYHFLFGLD